jgi:hypothetical protein
MDRFIDVMFIILMLSTISLGVAIVTLLLGQN